MLKIMFLILVLHAKSNKTCLNSVLTLFYKGTNFFTFRKNWGVGGCGLGNPYLVRIVKTVCLIGWPLSRGICLKFALSARRHHKKIKQLKLHNFCPWLYYLLCKIAAETISGLQCSLKMECRCANALLWLCRYNWVKVTSCFYGVTNSGV